jgi:ABC-type branched-subunit amino acid transport system substrate-binding protein
MSGSYHPPTPAWRRRWFLAGLTAAVLAVAAAAAYALWPAPPVYLTDGGHAYSADLKGVEQRILAENRAVRASGGPYVSVALMLPMRRTADDVFSEDWLRHQLQGAYLGQLTVNSTPSGAMDGKALPHIRLLLVDEGGQEQHWKDAVDAVSAHVAAPDRVVAATGLGLSLSEAGEAAEALSTAGPGGKPIPIVAVITADRYRDLPGLIRVTPSNAEEAQAAAAALTPGHGPRPKVMLVRDVNRDDDYASSLAEEFTGDYRGLDGTETYDSSLPGTGTVFGQMQSDICARAPQVVYFAGRSGELKEFLAQLAGRYCSGRKITVMTGDDATLLAGQQLWDIRSHPQAGIEVRLTGLASPQAWSSRFAAALPGAGQFGDCSVCFGRDFPGESLQDGAAIIGYDAMTAAVRAIRQTVSPQDLYSSPGAVTQELSHLRGVQGASGWLSFGAGAHSSDPIDKAIPIERLSPEGELSFVTLSAPSGSPPTGPEQ